VEEMREEFCNHKQWAYMQSFNIGSNYGQILEAAKIIRDKPNRILMKFETFDHKFSVCFVDNSKFMGLCELIKNYYNYRRQIASTDHQEGS
jgi:hypothetical protein